jgi:MGT family glycosyltransferase
LKLLFVQPDSGGGVPPAIAIASRLQEEGHELRFLAARGLRPLLADAGFACETFQRTPDLGLARPETDRVRDWEARTQLGAARALYWMMAGSAAEQAADVLASARAGNPDAIVCDFMCLGAFVAAEALRIPCIGLVHTVGVVPLPGLPPLPAGLRPARGLPGHVRDALLREARDLVLHRWVGGINQARAGYGLGPIEFAHELWSAATLLLITSSPAFDYPARQLPQNVRYVGPAFWEPRTEAEPEFELPPGSPFVLASLSTTYQAAERYLCTLVAALGKLPVSALVTTGAAYDATELGSLPPNVKLRSYVRHSLLLERAALFISHGGHGSVMRALSNGVPLVCVPFGRDQRDVALRAERTGAAVVLRSRLLSARRLSRAMQRVLNEPSYQADADRMARRLATENGAARGAAEIATLAKRRGDSQNSRNAGQGDDLKSIAPGPIE